MRTVMGPSEMASVHTEGVTPQEAHAIRTLQWVPRRRKEVADLMAPLLAEDRTLRSAEEAARRILARSGAATRQLGGIKDETE